MSVLDENSLGLISKFMSKGIRARFSLVSPEKHKRFIVKTLKEKDVEVYVHYPFCRSICKLCPYFRILYKPDVHKKYTQSLLKEIDEYRKLTDYNVIGMHIGGGTPSLMDPEEFRIIIDALDNPKHAGIEANPNDLVNLDYVSAVRSAGITEISIGVQSFSDRTLRALGRIHTVEDSKRAIINAKKVGFENINIDLMFLTPGETFDDWRKTLETAVELDPDQITAYPTLVAEHVKPRTKELKQNIKLFDYYVLFTDEFLREHGYKRIRVESWSKKGNYATVNLEMEGSLISFGAGGIGFTGGYEYVNIMNVYRYINMVNEIGFGASHGRIVEENERLVRIAMDQLYFGRLEENYIKSKLGKSFKDFPVWLKIMLFFLRVRGYLVKDNGAYIVQDKALPLIHRIIWTFVLKFPCRIVMNGMIYQNEDFVVP